MSKPSSPPTSARWLTPDEWALVGRVFGSTLPARQRIIVTNACGANGCPFTIPTSLITSLPLLASTAFATFLTKIPIFLGVGLLGAELASAANLAYLMNVGPGQYDDLTAEELDNQTDDPSGTLVHEMTHVWQGKNSALALSYVFSSVINQAFGGHGAYSYKVGDSWKSLNAEQQGQLVEDWWWKENASETGSRFPYIRDYVRKGIV